MQAAGLHHAANGAGDQFARLIKLNESGEATRGVVRRVDLDPALWALAVELAGSAEEVSVRRDGAFGEQEAANATPLALVLAVSLSACGAFGGKGKPTKKALRALPSSEVAS